MQKFDDAYKKEMADIKPSDEFKKELIKKMKKEQSESKSKNSDSKVKRLNIKKLIGATAAVAASAAIIIGAGAIFSKNNKPVEPDTPITQVADSHTNDITARPDSAQDSQASGNNATTVTAPDSGDNTTPVITPGLENTVAPGTTIPLAQHLLAYGAQISVEDIKNAYSVDDSRDIMPLYNVAQDEAFHFTFNFNGFDADVDLYDYVSVHTDKECKPESKIYFTAHYDVIDDKTYYTAAPMEPILHTQYQQNNYVYERIDTWGNAPMYYLAIHYDMNADTPVKLEKPIIIPFTVRNEVNAPNAKGVVDETGRFKLVWDPVEGAEKYNIYKLTDGSLYTGRDNHAINGAQTGYQNLAMLWDGETTECYFDNFAGEQHGLAVISDNIAAYAIGQNYCVNGEYYVSAVVNGIESGVSTAIKTSDLSIPYIVEDENEILFNSYPEPKDFPIEIDVLYIDGTTHKHRIAYERVEGVDIMGYFRIQYNYSIVGTAITGYVYPELENLEHGLDWIGVPGEDFVPEMVKPVTDEAFVTDMVKPVTDVNMIPDNNVATIITVDDVNVIAGENTDDTDNIDTSDISIDNHENNDPSTGVSLIDIQQENTKDHIKLGNKKTVENVPEGVYIIADSAEEEWLALNLVHGNTEISVEPFPSLQDPHVLVETVSKVYTQNHFIFGVTSYTYDYNTLTLLVTYNLTQEEICKMQTALITEATKIVAELENELTDKNDESKVIAFYNYLRSNVEYDNEAANAAQEHNFLKSELADYEHSFNAYGALLLHKGLCQSYASAFKLLCDLSEIECSVVTGFVRGNVPHAWNEFTIDGQTYELDASYEFDFGEKPYVTSWSEYEFTNSLAYTRGAIYQIN